MKRFFLLLVTACITYASDAQIVVNSTFKPMSYEEMIAPYALYKQYYEECASKLEGIAEYTEQIEVYINKAKDPKAWKRYVDCYNAVVTAYDNMAKEGANEQTRLVIARLKKRSQLLLKDIRSAYERRRQMASDQYARLNTVNGLRCDRFVSDISLDEFMYGRTPKVNYQKQ